MNYTKEEILDLLENLKAYVEIEKILSTFVPALTNNTESSKEGAFLHGNFNLSGAKSGRLSSSGPNLQNLPSTGTKYAKPIKKCFKAPKGWIMVGADFNALEDRINTLLTKDPNKIKVYTDGYDGHCLRAYSYFSDQMPDIDPNSVESINSIADKYPDLRQASKGPSFALIYLGTNKTLVDNFGFSKKEAIKIENGYHKLYEESDKWLNAKISKAFKDGYVDLAFGLKLRTPILANSIFDHSTLTKEAHKEVKSAANALSGQSYCLLNTRAANEFMERVWNSQWATDVLPIAQIHDSQYYMIRDNINLLYWVNNNLIECMEWCKLPELYHPTIKLTAKLEVYYPTWANKIVLPNKINQSQIKEIIRAYQQK